MERQIVIIVTRIKLLANYQQSAHRDGSFGTLSRTENPCVPGSNPGLGTNKLKGLQLFGCDPFFCLWSFYGPSADFFAPDKFNWDNVPN